MFVYILVNKQNLLCHWLRNVQWKKTANVRLFSCDRHVCLNTKEHLKQIDCKNSITFSTMRLVNLSMLPYFYEINLKNKSHLFMHRSSVVRTFISFVRKQPIERQIQVLLNCLQWSLTLAYYFYDNYRFT